MCSLMAMEHEFQFQVTVIQDLDTIHPDRLLLALIWRINLKLCEYLLMHAGNDSSSV